MGEFDTPLLPLFPSHFDRTPRALVTRPTSPLTLPLVLSMLPVLEQRPELLDSHRYSSSNSNISNNNRDKLWPVRSDQTLNIRVLNTLNLLGGLATKAGHWTIHFTLAPGPVSNSNKHQGQPLRISRDLRCKDITGTRRPLPLVTITLAMLNKQQRSLPISTHSHICILSRRR